MKTCKNCRQIVNIETVTCPYCEGHEFKINPVKICSLCGKVNDKRNTECELCGKSFSGRANEYAISTVMNLTHKEDGDVAERSARQAGSLTAQDVKESTIAGSTPRERYTTLKAQIEEGENEDRCAYFIPGELREKPIVLLPSFEESKKVDVYLVLANKEMPADIGMQKIAVSKEEDINILNEKRRDPRKISIAALFLFWLNFVIIYAFGLKMLGEITGFQIISGSFKGNMMGQAVIALIKDSSSFGNFAYLVYPILFGLIVVELVISLIFLNTKTTKAKKVFLILMQAIIFALTIGIYLINSLMIEGIKWSDFEAGIIVMIVGGLLGLITSIFYKYPKEIQQREENRPGKGKEETKEQAPDNDDNQLVGLGFDEDNIY